MTPVRGRMDNLVRIRRGKQIRHFLLAKQVPKVPGRPSDFQVALTGLVGLDLVVRDLILPVVRAPNQSVALPNQPR